MLTAEEYLTEGVAVGRMMQGRSISSGKAYEAGLKAIVKYDPKVCFFFLKKGARGGKKLEGNKTNCAQRFMIKSSSQCNERKKYKYSTRPITQKRVYARQDQCGHLAALREQE